MQNVGGNSRPMEWANPQLVACLARLPTHVLPVLSGKVARIPTRGPQMGTIVVRGPASFPLAGCIDIQYLAHPHTDRYDPSTIGTLGHGAGTFGRRTFSCFWLEQVAVVWEG